MANTEARTGPTSWNTGPHTGDGGPILPTDELCHCFKMIVDDAAEPTDWDDAVASFLLSCVRKRSTERLVREAEEEISVCA